MSPARRIALLAACHHLRKAQRDLARGLVWPAVLELADAEFDLGTFIGLDLDDTDHHGRRRYLIVRAAAYTLRSEVRLAIDVGEAFESMEDREQLVRDVAHMIRPLSASEEMIEERARNVVMLLVLEAAHHQLGGRRARAAAVRAARLRVVRPAAEAAG